MPQRHCAAGWRTALQAYGDTVLHLGHAGGRPRGPFSFLTLGPGAHGALEDHLPAIGLDRDTVGVDLGAAPERLLDLALDLVGGRPRFEDNLIADPLHAFHPTDTGCGSF